MPLLTAETVSESMVSYRGVRGWLDEVSRMGELLQVNGAHWDVEMGALTHMLTEKSSGTAPALLFDDIPGYPKGFRTLYGHFSSTRRVAFTPRLPLKQDPDVAWFNLGAFRSQVYAGKTVGSPIPEGKHGRIPREKYLERGPPMKVV